MDVCSVAQSCPILRDTIDLSSPGSSVHGFSQARILEQVVRPPPWDLPDPGIEPTSLMLPEFAHVFFPLVPPRKHSHFNALLQIKVFCIQLKVKVSSFTHIQPDFFIMIIYIS